MSIFNPGRSQVTDAQYAAIKRQAKRWGRDFSLNTELNKHLKETGLMEQRRLDRLRETKRGA